MNDMPQMSDAPPSAQPAQTQEQTQEQTQVQTQVQMLRLQDPNEAFRAISVLMGADKDYAATPLAIAQRLWTAVCQGNYWLLVADSEPVGCVLWGHISSASLAASLRQRREPSAQQLQAHGDALLALALVAKTPSLVSALWRRFVRLNAQRPILAIRHFGQRNQQPRFLLYLNGHACNDEQQQHWLGQQPEASSAAAAP